MNKTFDFNRFKMVIRWDILSNWKTYFRTMIGLAFGITLTCPHLPLHFS